jgi:hypothetical protein
MPLPVKRATSETTSENCVDGMKKHSIQLSLRKFDELLPGV